MIILQPIPWSVWDPHTGTSRMVDMCPKCAVGGVVDWLKHSEFHERVGDL